VGFVGVLDRGVVEGELVGSVDGLDVLAVGVELADVAEVVPLGGPLAELFGAPDALERVPVALCEGVPVVAAVKELWPRPAECG